MRILSGIQSTGQKHLGNYIGAVRHYVLQQERPGTENFYFIADLHALTVLPDPATLREDTAGTAALLLAAGVDPERSTLFAQSHVAAEHTQLHWVFECMASMGELSRMTQYKDKTGGKGDKVGVGIFTYPVLQVGDIVAYDAEAVPVGADQKQHIELARNIAQRFNRRYASDEQPILVVPEPMIAEVGGRVVDLQEPTKKMSTSSGTEKGTVWILDEPDVIRKKFRSAVTDSENEVRFDREAKPGVSGLLELLSIVTDRPVAELEAEFADGGYGNFKTAVGDAVADYLAPVRERWHELMDDRAELDRILASGAERAREVAQATVARVNQAVGVGSATSAATASR
jgi:tryptophanyl-tRNA synthetase